MKTADGAQSSTASLTPTNSARHPGRTEVHQRDTPWASDDEHLKRVTDAAATWLTLRIKAHEMKLCTVMADVAPVVGRGSNGQLGTDGFTRSTRRLIRRRSRSMWKHFQPETSQHWHELCQWPWISQFNTNATSPKLSVHAPTRFSVECE